VVYCAITALDGYPSHSDNIHYIRLATLIYALLPSTDHGHHFHLRHSSHPPLLPADVCLCRAEPPEHVISSFVTGMTVTSAHQEARPCGSITSETSHGMWWKPRTWKILKGDKVPLGDNKGATVEMYLKHMIRFIEMYPPFLTSTLTSKGLHS